jgi:hypothetical protein
MKYLPDLAKNWQMFASLHILSIPKSIFQKSNFSPKNRRFHAKNNKKSAKMRAEIYRYFVF